jgi:hypothetical protein
MSTSTLKSVRLGLTEERSAVALTGPSPEMMPS